MTPSFQAAIATAWELRRRVTRVTSHVASRGAAYTRRVLTLARLIRNAPAVMLKVQAQKRATFAVEATPTSPRNSVSTTVVDRDRPVSLCNASKSTGKTSVARIRNEISSRDGVVVELGPKPPRPLRTAPRGLIETATSDDCMSAFHFKSLEELSSALVATLQRNEVEESPTADAKLRSASGPSDLNTNSNERIESVSEVELCILILTETAGALQDIFRDRPDLLPREFLDDLQQANRKIVKRLSKMSFKEHEFRRNQVLH
jgi:hypothetical protein